MESTQSDTARRVCRNARGFPKSEGQVRLLGRAFDGPMVTLREASGWCRIIRAFGEDRTDAIRTTRAACRPSVSERTRSFYLRGRGSTPRGGAS